MNQRIFPWMPVLLLMFLFAADKLLLIPDVRLYIQSWRKLSSAVYESRALVLKRFAREVPERRAAGEKPGIVLGASRSASFDTRLLKRLRPGTFAYNFNASGAPPSDYFYSFEKITAITSDLAYLIIEFDPPHLLPKTAIHSLSYSYDLDFVARHVELNRPGFSDPWQARGKGFSFDEGETWLLKRLFASYRYPPAIEAVRQNMRRVPHPRKRGETIRLAEFKRELLRGIPLEMEANRGSFPGGLIFARTPRALRAHAKKSERRYLKRFRAAPSQVIFLRKLLRGAAMRRIPVLIYWPVVARSMRERMRAAGLVEPWQNKIRVYMRELEKEYPGARLRIVDLNEDPRFECRRFLDSFHLSSDCYSELTRHLLARLPASMRDITAARR